MQCFLRVTDDSVSTSHRCNISVRDEARCHPQVISVTPPIFLPFSRKITPTTGYLCFLLFSHQIFPPMAVCHYWSISLRRSSVPIKTLTIPIQQDFPNCTRGGHVVRFPDLLGTFMASGNLTRGSWLPKCPTRWSLWYWYLDFYVDHLYFNTQMTEKYSTAMC